MPAEGGDENSRRGSDGKRPSDNRGKKVRRANGARDAGDSENCGSEGV